MFRGLILRSVRGAPRAHDVFGRAERCVSRAIQQYISYAGLLCLGFGGVKALGVCTVHGSPGRDHPSVSANVVLV